MPKEERKKGTHLTWDDRHEIQKGLKEHRTFKEIAYIIGCSPDTVSKEIRRHRYHKLRSRDGILHASPNRCKYRNSCRRWDVCKKKKGHKCRIPCRECISCNKLCPDFVDAPCPIEHKAPYVCNNCPKSISCLFDKYLYNAAESSVLMASGGVASVLETERTLEEYIQIAQDAQGASWGYTNIGVANVESGNLNVRAVSSTDGKLVGKLPKDAACEVVETVDDWAHIKSGEVEGYVSKEFLLTGPEARIRAMELVHTVAIANTDGLNVRQEPNTTSEIVTQVGQGEEMEYVETGSDGWVKISIDGEDAYVSQDYVTVEEKLDTAITMTELLYGQGVSDVRVDLVEYAKQFIGNPYVWGGTSLTKGADCSGFVLSVFKKYGITLSHSSRAQANEGTKISASELKPGDLVFYGNGKGNINHVAIYIGGGQVIHASSPKTGIKISSYKYRTPVKCVRVIHD